MDSESVKAAAREAGFELCGIARAESTLESAFYPEWIRRGFHGKMGYLEGPRGEMRTDPRTLLPSARSVISVGQVYNAPYRYSTESDDPDAGWVARYAWGRDYHDTMKERLRGLVRRLEESAEFDSQDLRRHLPAARTRLRPPRRPRLDRQEHLPHQRANRFLVPARRDPDLPRTRHRRTRPIPLRDLYPLHRCLPNGRLRRDWRRRTQPCPRRPPLHLLLDDRTKRRHPRRQPCRNRSPRLRLRHLPRRLPLESSRPRRDHRRRGVPTRQRRALTRKNSPP